MADECDLDSLTALLDDSDMEDDTANTKENDSQENNHNDNDNCDLDEITAFLEQSDSEGESDHELENKESRVKDDKMNHEDQSEDVASQNNTEEKQNCDNGVSDNLNTEADDKHDEDDDGSDDEDQGNSNENGSEVNNIQAELLEMQRKMQELQERLVNSQSATPKPNKKRKDEKPCKSKPGTLKKDKTSHDQSSQIRCSKIDKPSDGSQKERNSSANSKHSLSAIDQSQKRTDKLSSDSKAKSSAITNQISLNQEKNLKNESAVSGSLIVNSETKNCRTVDSISKQDIIQSSNSSSQGKLTSPPQNFYKSNAKSGSPALQEDEENPFFPPYKSKSEKSNTSPVDRKVMEKELFGDDDSDWEPMEEDDKVKLSDEGHELSKLMKDHGKSRHSIVTSEEVAAIRKKAQKNNWKAKGLPVTSDSSSSQKSAKENEAPCVTDPFSGIRIINPKISSLEMKSKMRDRKLVKVSNIDRRVSEHDNWVTVGVIVSKTEPRQSSTGKTYCIWKLSDLNDCDKTITFFLFGEVYKQHWKNEVTSVVGILNPNLMDKAEKAQSDMAFTVNHPGQIMMMGYSKDFGRCAAMTGKGNNTGKHCTNFINKQQGEYCTYHVQRAYSKKCAQRTELQGSYSGMTPSNHKYKPKDKKDGFFFYQGHTYTTGKMPGNKDSKQKVTIDKLKKQQALVGGKKVTTMSLHAIDPEDLEKLRKLENPKEEANPLLDMLTVPTPGSMNFVKHLMTKDKKPEVNPETGKAIMQSVTAADLLKQHKQAMRQRKQAKSSGGITLPPPDPLKCTPTLGRGLAPGGDICLEFSGSPKLDLARRKAIAKIHAKGGISKEDPNAVRKKKSPEAHQKIKKRIHEMSENELDGKDQSQEPPRKRSKLLGNIDENSEEFKQLMKARSKHTGALAEVEAEMEDRYFMEQEKKERLEDKMASTMEVKAVVFTCKKCNYTAFKPKDECKQQNHELVKIQTMKRFFKCKKCGNRTTSIDKLPTESCRNCGENNFERVSMLQERKGPKLPHEQLCIRGDEIKFLGSMSEKVYL